jgi:hypothetical protein
MELAHGFVGCKKYRNPLKNSFGASEWTLLNLGGVINVAEHEVT